MRSKEVDFGKESCAYNILLNLWRNQDDYAFRRRSKSVSEEEEFSDWTFTVHLQYSKHIFS